MFSRFFRRINLVRRYNELLHKHPTFVMATTSGISMGLGNFICQAFGENKTLYDIDYTKMIRFSLFAFFITVIFYLNVVMRKASCSHWTFQSNRVQL
jgi:hypothetical protein